MEGYFSIFCQMNRGNLELFEYQSNKNQLIQNAEGVGPRWHKMVNETWVSEKILHESDLVTSYISFEYTYSTSKMTGPAL